MLGISEGQRIRAAPPLSVPDLSPQHSPALLDCGTALFCISPSRKWIDLPLLISPQPSSQRTNSIRHARAPHVTSQGLGFGKQNPGSPGWKARVTSQRVKLSEKEEGQTIYKGKLCGLERSRAKPHSHTQGWEKWNHFFLLVYFEGKYPVPVPFCSCFVLSDFQSLNCAVSMVLKPHSPDPAWHTLPHHSFVQMSAASALCGLGQE